MTFGKKGTVLLLVLVVSLLAISGFAKAISGSMGNARMVLYPEVDGQHDVVIAKTILVRNINNETLNMTLVVEPDAKDFLEVVDKQFILAPNESQNAKFNVKVKKEGTYQGKIDVFFTPLNPKESGIVLSSTVIVIAKKNQDYQNTPDNTDNTSQSDNQTTDNANTGNKLNNGSNGDGIGSGILFLVVTSTLLIILLIALIVILNKRKSGKRNGGRR